MQALSQEVIAGGSFYENSGPLCDGPGTGDVGSTEGPRSQWVSRLSEVDSEFSGGHF